MSERFPTREEAWALLTAHMKSEMLLRHSLAVEAAMRRMAEELGGDPEAWGTAGLLHDIDYEEHPDEHCGHAGAILTAAGCPEPLVRAVLSHGYGICTDVEPLTPMEKALYAVDELTGLVAASALVRPSKSVHDLPVKSVKKKWKDKAFAAGVDRSIIDRGAAMLGMETAALIALAIEGMRRVAPAIGLEGNPEQ